MFNIIIIIIGVFVVLDVRVSFKICIDVKIESNVIFCL